MVGDHDEWRRRQRWRAVGFVTVLATSWLAAIIVMLMLHRAWPSG